MTQLLTLESRIRSAALDRLPSLWALLMLATLLPLQAEAVPPGTESGDPHVTETA